MRDLAIYKHIEKMFFKYDAIKKAIWEARNDSYTPFGFEGGHAHVSDTTANKAISAAMPIKSVFINNDKEIYTIRRPEDWIAVYDASYNHFQSTDRIIANVMTMRYREKCNYLMISDKLFISKSLVYNYRDNIVVYAALTACQLGLVKVCGES